MSPIFAVDRNRGNAERGNHQPPMLCNTLRFGVGQALYHAGSEGMAWRVRNGVVRLDTLGPTGKLTFASLAITGDILGCETLLLGAYTFSASALTQCELIP